VESQKVESKYEPTNAPIHVLRIATRPEGPPDEAGRLFTPTNKSDLEGIGIAALVKKG
jgi:hypothetical protein